MKRIREENNKRIEVAKTEKSGTVGNAQHEAEQRGGATQNDDEQLC